MDPDGTFDVGRELAAAQPAQDARRDAAEFPGARGARGGRRDVLPVAPELCRLGKVPFRDGAARRAGYAGVARGGGTGRSTETPGTCAWFAGSIPGRHRL